MRTELVSIVIMTYNEEIHIARCLESAFRICRDVYIVDSNSTDRTHEIAKSAGAVVFARDFRAFSEKINWALENIEFKTPWVMRLDADEVLSDELVAKVGPYLEALDSDTVGVYVRRQLWFMGKWIRHGGMYPTYTMRLWRPDAVWCEARDVDEHMLLKRGHAATLSADVKDIPLTGLSTWVGKHNRYSTYEAESALQRRAASEFIKPDLFGNPPQRARWLKINVFYRLPPFVRPIMYFIYRYFFRLGFLDGRAGFAFHFLQGLWYRMLVDAKIMELTERARGQHADQRS